MCVCACAPRKIETPALFNPDMTNGKSDFTCREIGARPASRVEIDFFNASARACTCVRVSVRVRQIGFVSTRIEMEKRAAIRALCCRLFHFIFFVSLRRLGSHSLFFFYSFYLVIAKREKRNIRNEKCHFS